MAVAEWAARGGGAFPHSLKASWQATDDSLLCFAFGWRQLRLIVSNTHTSLRRWSEVWKPPNIKI
jgi:hypothetical protein